MPGQEASTLSLGPVKHPRGHELKETDSGHLAQVSNQQSQGRGRTWSAPPATDFSFLGSRGIL